MPRRGAPFRVPSDVQAAIDHAVERAAAAAPAATGGGGAASWGTITGTLSAQTDLQTALTGKAATAHTHIIDDTTGLQTALDGKASQTDYLYTEGVVESHTIDIQDLQFALTAKAPLVHTHAEADVTGLIADLASKEATANKGVANGYASLDGTGKVPAAQLPAGGETNTASNVGTAGVGLFKQKTAVDLEFKKLNAGSSKITVTDDTANSKVDVDADANAIVAASTDARLSDARAPTPHTHPEADLAFTDIITANASTAAHGLMQKYPGGTTTFLRADGTFTAPPAGAGATATRVVATAAFPASRNKRVTIVDALVSTSSRINAWVSGIADGQPNAGDLVDLHALRAIANAGSFDLDLDFLTPWAGSLSIDYVVFA